MADKNESRMSASGVNTTMMTAGGATATAMTATTGPPAASMTVRARRRREEAVRRLVADVQSKTDRTILSQGDVAVMAETHDWLVASTVATALEKGLDRDLHAELVQEAKDNAGRIGQVCHDHADVFLASVAQVASLGEPCADLADGIRENHRELENQTAGPMHDAYQQWEQAKQSYARGKILHIMVDACQRVAIQLERARKQATLGRPRAALDAVDQARTALTTPMETLFEGKEKDLWKAIAVTAASNPQLGEDELDMQDPDDADRKNVPSHEKQDALLMAKQKLFNLEQTPFGARASVMLPKIEYEVLMSARRGLNRWFLALRSGGEAAKVGRSALRQCATSLAIGPGLLGLGGAVPPSYIWRAKAADNLLARIDQSSRVARASRLGYFFDRDAPKEAERIEKTTQEGLERRIEAIVSAFGFYRCWLESSSLLVDAGEFADSSMDGSMRSSLTGSRHGIGRSGHGGSRHGSSLRSSRHGKGRSLGFRASTNSRSQAFQEISSTLGSAAVGKADPSQRTQWCELLTPDVLNEKAATRYVVADHYFLLRFLALSEINEFVDSYYCSRLFMVANLRKEDDRLLLALPESVHPVRRAELAFTLLGKTDEFVDYYESNRFGETKVVGDRGEGERKSYLSALTGDDVTQGTHRVFFAKTLSHLCASVTGFCAVEAALEMGNFDDDEDTVLEMNGGKNGSKGKSIGPKHESMSAGGFHESSERYERSLIAELGSVFRSRSVYAQFGELIRASVLMSVMRASLKIVHPSSTTRRLDKDLLTVDKDILITAIKLAQDEQMKVTSGLVHDDMKIPMLVAEAEIRHDPNKRGVTGIPDPEVCGLPFGLSNMIQVPQKAELDFQERSRTSYNRASMDEAYTFSPCVPVVVRSLHARAIACAAFALSQLELGQSFPEKTCSPAAGFLLDCVERCADAAAIGLKDSSNIVDEGSVEKAVQVMANISALQHCLPRLFGTLMRGMCHTGLIRSEEVESTFAYAERSLKIAEKSCDAQVGSTYSLVYEICRNKIDSHINLALENFQWVAKAARDMPNAYCEGLIGYLKSVFASLGPMDEGSRAGLHFSCCGHVAERLVKLLSGKPGDTATFDDSGLPPITRIDAFGIKNLAVDCEEFERFADTTGVPQLRDCFNELRVLTSVMLDKELPILLLPENAAARRRKYPILSLEKVFNILEKYQGTGLVSLVYDRFEQGSSAVLIYH